VGQVGNLPHTFSSFQGVARDMNDSSEVIFKESMANWTVCPTFSEKSLCNHYFKTCVMARE
jgi:hypothetical protein